MKNLEENTAAKLAVIAATITTLGDALATIASILALQEEQQPSPELEKIQKQLNYLTNEVQQLKRSIRRN